MNESSPTSSFVWLTDIHYDPYFGQAQAMNRHGSECIDATSAQIGCDSPKTLVTSAFDGVRRYYAGESTAPDFIVLSGDFCRHQMEKLEDAKTKELPSILTTVLRGIQSEMGNDVPYLPVVGNDDAIPDYFLDITDTSSTSLLNIMSKVFLDTQVLTSDEARMFARGGFYKKNIPGQGTNLTILCLNTVIYCLYHQPIIPSYDTDPLDQFTWLERELSLASSENRAVYIVGHIPPTIASYDNMDMWRSEYQSLYTTIVQKYASTIRAQLYGHFHSDEFRLADQMPPLFVGPSITPVYSNNPSFRIVTYNRASGTILDMESHSLNVTDPSSSNWAKLYSFRESYDLSDLSTASIQTLVDRLPGNELLLRKLLFHYKSGLWSKKSIQCLEDVETCSKKWKCLVTSNTRADFLKCADGDGSSTVGMWTGAAVAVLGLLASCLVLRWCRIRQRRYQYNAPAEEAANEIVGNSQKVAQNGLV